VNLAHLGVYTRALQRIGIEVIHAPFASSIDDAIQSRGPEFDLVYITRHHVARAVMSLVRKHAPRAKIIFNNADLHFLRELRAALAAKDGDLLRRSRLTRDRELEVMRQADLTLSYSEAEHAVIQSHNFDQSKVAKAPWVAVPADQVAPFSARSDIAFIGSFGHAPNVEAVRFFSSQVMPHLRRRLPGIRFFIYGSQTGPQIEALAADDVIVAGHVDDLAAMFAKARIFVAPLLSGAGLKAKVLCAMAFGVPSVLSPAAAEGVGGQAGTDYQVAQSADEWARAIHALYCDETKWLKASKAGLELVRANYSFEKGLETLRRALESIDVFAPANPGALWCRTAFPPLL
jgi:glycosyltransferase involved in cell wall biosynthesis